jgi:hypothetical protein
MEFIPCKKKKKGKEKSNDNRLRMGQLPNLVAKCQKKVMVKSRKRKQKLFMITTTQPNFISSSPC